MATFPQTINYGQPIRDANGNLVYNPEDMVNAQFSSGEGGGDGQYSQDPISTPAGSQSPAPLPGTAMTPINANSNFNSSTNPKDIWYDERQRARSQEDIFDQEQRDRGNAQLPREEAAFQETQQLYRQLLEEPGYTQEERQQILREAEGQGIHFTPDEISSFGLQDYEQEQIRGDPYNALNTHFNPSYYDDIGGEGNKRTREATQYLSDDLGSSVDELRSNVGGAIDIDRLRQDPAYRAQVMSNLEQGGSDVRSAVFDPGLDITDRYMQKRGYDDSDVQAMAEAAARDVGLRHRAAISDLERSANRAGISDPYALNAARTRFENQAAPLAADARTDARLSAMEKQKNAEQAIQDTQLGAAGTRADLRSGAALGLLDRQSSALSDMERSRIGAEQGLTGYRLQGAGMVSDMDYDAAKTGGLTRLQNERDIRDTQLSGEEWKTSTVLPAAERAEGLSSSRAAGLAANRQSVTRDVAGNRQSTAGRLYDTQSSRQTTLANARRQGQGEARDYYGDERDYAGNQYAQSLANRLTNRGMTTGASQGAAQGTASWQQRPKFWQTLVKTGVDAAIGGLTGGLSGGGSKPSSSSGGSGSRDGGYDEWGWT